VRCVNNLAALRSQGSAARRESVRACVRACMRVRSISLCQRLGEGVSPERGLALEAFQAVYLTLKLGDVGEDFKALGLQCG
jgi:hypothetical protein